MLLELYAADSGDRRLSISRLSERTQTALTTTLRWIQALESEGLVERARHRSMDARSSSC
ncbi:helix-turn-helix domain-containing protein (plasmid) [Sphingomonas daechungensis]|uniref:Helix-turn-helix domain-containing protein n=1 Tax=Sphingomonas daechungensis TaxID=1176646 RepID=A0ABX6T5R4_9SPHN|nr:helix-turn-helix domain-containing protein [Sphingomonas daechungensis]QNP44548.1 helix-turn-helix domain-containing protein [Sphingomonas daechungensis]